MAASKEKNSYLELKSLDEQIKQLHAQMEKLDEQVAELNSSKSVINKFLELKQGNKLRVPIASGVYITAKLADIKKLLVNVGAGVSVEKTPKEVIEILDSQLVELIQYRDQIIDQMKVLIARVEEIQKEFEKS